MTSTLAGPCISPDADIAGIGVRVAVYIQAALNLVLAVIFAKDGYISSYETLILRNTSKNLFITGCAILVTAFIQTGTTGVSVYHALIVLNLSWVNALSALLYLIIRSYNACVWFLGHSPSGHNVKPNEKGPSATILFPSVLNFVGMGVFGIIVWSKITTFGNTDQRQCTPRLFLTLFGHDVPVTTPSLRRASLALYSIALLPFVNIGVLVLIGIVVAAVLNCSWWLASGALNAVKGEDEDKERQNETQHRFLLISGAVLMGLVEALFIVDTELMIFRSSHLVKAGEDQWTFGQVLAMVLVVNPLYQTVAATYRSWGSTDSDPQRRRTDPPISWPPYTELKRSHSCQVDCHNWHH